MTVRMRRFFYVRAPKGRVLHIFFGKTHSEGTTKCGKFAAKGWGWMNRGSTPLCKRCAT
jgi:predicted DNA-binding WGR domain protein